MKIKANDFSLFCIVLAMVSMCRFMFLHQFYELPQQLSYFDQYDLGLVPDIYGLNDSYKFEYAVQSSIESGSNAILAYWHQSAATLFIEIVLRKLLGSVYPIKALVIFFLLRPLALRRGGLLNTFLFLYLLFYLCYSASGPSKDFLSFIFLYLFFDSILLRRHALCALSLMFMLPVRPNVFFSLLIALFSSYILTGGYFRAGFLSGKINRFFPISAVLAIPFLIASWSYIVYGFSNITELSHFLDFDYYEMLANLLYIPIAPLPTIPTQLLLFVDYASNANGIQTINFIVFLLSSVLPFCSLTFLRLYLKPSSFSSASAYHGFKLVVVTLVVSLVFVSSTGYVLRAVQLLVGSAALSFYSRNHLKSPSLHTGCLF
jgi:hypothetical protein